MKKPRTEPNSVTVTICLDCFMTEEWSRQTQNTGTSVIRQVRNWNSGRAGIIQAYKHRASVIRQKTNVCTFNNERTGWRRMSSKSQEHLLWAKKYSSVESKKGSNQKECISSYQWSNGINPLSSCLTDTHCDPIKIEMIGRLMCSFAAGCFMLRGFVRSSTSNFTWKKR